MRSRYSALVRCFFTTVLGPGASKAGGAVTGVPLDDLTKAWDAPFQSEDAAAGGCPALPIPPAEMKGEWRQRNLAATDRASIRGSE